MELLPSMRPDMERSARRFAASFSSCRSVPPLANIPTTLTGYGANYERLAALKAKYDPTNLFRMNLNITPAG